MRVFIDHLSTLRVDGLHVIGDAIVAGLKVTIDCGAEGGTGCDCDT